MHIAFRYIFIEMDIWRGFNWFWAPHHMLGRGEGAHEACPALQTRKGKRPSKLAGSLQKEHKLQVYNYAE